MMMKKNLKSIVSSNVFVMEGIDTEIPKYCLPEKSIDADSAYKLVTDLLMTEGNARLNLATFCQTYMEPQATRIISETLNKNAIDKSLYVQTAEIEDRCVEIISDLWNRPTEEKTEIPKGTSTIGSSEACMLGGLAMKVRWEEWAKENNINRTDKKPNLIVTTGYQVCWEKFEKYWDVDLIQIPVDEDHLSLNVEMLKEKIDEYTIGVVAILGITYTGLYDNVKAIDEVVKEYNTNPDNKGQYVGIHVDAASGGFYEPFIDPDYEWDFRIENVVSINASGHKYGLVYPGIGWVIWRDSKCLPKKLTFSVSYLGGTVLTVGINFSKSAGQIIGQYYNFIRLGNEGYTRVHQATKAVAEYIEKGISEIIVKHGNPNDKTSVEFKPFEIMTGGSKDDTVHKLPLVFWKFSDENEKKGLKRIGWDLYDLSDRMLMRGWQIPTYPLPANMTDVIIQRIVCRADLSMDTAEMLVEDMRNAAQYLFDKQFEGTDTFLKSNGLQKRTPRIQGFTH